MIDCDISIRRQKQGIKVIVKPANGVKLSPRVFNRPDEVVAYLRGLLK